MSLRRFLLYIRTIRFLKPIQIRFRIYYFLKNKLDPFIYKKKLIERKASRRNLTFNHLLHAPTSYVGNRVFTFLNKQVVFTDRVNWNYDQNGKLWTYNLCYFDCLRQKNFSIHEGLSLMKEFRKNYKNIRIGLEPYPTSLRIINWIKFLSVHDLEENELDNIIYSDLIRLSKNVEYHLMGNHLLENGFALLFGGVYFANPKILDQAEKILYKQLEEQVLPDGAHFELSPMYHQIILEKTLDCINLLMNNSLPTSNLLLFLRSKSQLMAGWMFNISFKDGTIPKLNDSADNVSPSTSMIDRYISALNLNDFCSLPLKESGYRKFDNHHYEAIIDIGKIGPDYIPGHAHSDTFNILINCHQIPVLVDTGTSTYEKNLIRQQERGTSAHNTVVINRSDQSEVWDGFRVGRRANCTIMAEKDGFVSACHDGYRKIGIIHTRSFKFESNQIVLEDKLNDSAQAMAYFHFHPEINLEYNENVVDFEFGVVEFENLSNLEDDTYQFALGFNQTTPSQVLKISFEQSLTSTFRFK